MRYVFIDVADGDVGMFESIERFEAALEVVDFVGREDSCRFFNSDGDEYALEVESSIRPQKWIKFLNSRDERVKVKQRLSVNQSDLLRGSLVERADLDDSLSLAEAVDQFVEKCGYGWT